MALPCRHFSYCSQCVESVNECIAPIEGGKSCHQAILYKQRVFQVHPNEECPCSRCTICYDRDAIYAKIPTGSLELCGECVQNMRNGGPFPYTNLNLVHGDIKLLVKIIRSPVDISSSFPDYLKVERTKAGQCKLMKVDGSNKIIFDAVGADLNYLDTHRLSLHWEKMEINSIIDQDGNSILHLACEKGYWELVEKILMECASLIVDRPNRYGATALFLAAANGHLKIVRILLEATIVDILALQMGQIDALEMTLYYSNSSNSSNSDAKLNINKTQKDLPIETMMPYLVDRKYGGTYRPQMNPFGYIHNNNGSSRYLLGSTAFSIAQLNRHFEIVALLKRYFPDESTKVKSIQRKEVLAGHDENGIDYTDARMFTSVSPIVRVVHFGDSDRIEIKENLSTRKFYGGEKMVVFSCCNAPGYKPKGMIVYGNHGTRKRYFGEMEMDYAYDQEVPNGYGIMLYKDGKYDMGIFEKDEYSLIKKDLNPLSTVASLKKLVSRFF